MPTKFNIIKKGGYDTVEVDRYIENMESMIRGYKEKDSSIKNAIINAQIAADDIVKRAELHAIELKNDTIKQMAAIKNSIEYQKRKIEDFQVEYNKMINKYIREFNADDMELLIRKLEDIENGFTDIATSAKETGTNEQGQETLGSGITSEELKALL